MDLHRLQAALSRPAISLGVLPDLAQVRPRFSLHLYDSLNSTNQQTWQLAAAGAPAGTVVIARQQRAGRGQWGRTWLSEPGGLYLSILLEPNLAIFQSSLLTLASAWGIATSFERLGIPIQIKWPNDLVSRGLKLGGILTESRIGILETETVDREHSAQQLRYAVIGVGINWRNPIPPNAIALYQLLPDSPSSPPVESLEDVAAVVLRGVLQGYYFWQSQGSDSLISAYEQRLWHRGKQVEVDGRLMTIMGVSSKGELIVGSGNDGRNGIQCLKPGEIRLGYGSIG